jgi:hypothetical protein
MPEFWKSDKAKAVLAGVLVVAAVAVFWLRMGKSHPLAERISFVCVSTGKTFSIDRNKINGIPAENPETHQRTLLPCYQEDGQLYVSRRYAGPLSKELKDANHHVDPKSLQVRTTP